MLHWAPYPGVPVEGEIVILCTVYYAHLKLVQKCDYSEMKTYCWPSGQQLHVMSHSSWTGRSHWL